MRLYQARPVMCEVTEHLLRLSGEKRYSVQRSDGIQEWLTPEQLATKYAPVNGEGWPSVTRGEENA